MVVTSHGSTSSSTSSQDHQSLDNYDLDMAHGGIHNPNDSEYQVHVAFQIQPKSEYEYGADTSDEKNTILEYQSQHENNNTRNKDLVDTSGRRALSSSFPSDDNHVYTDAHSTPTTSTVSALKNRSLSPVAAEVGPISSTTTASMGTSWRKRSSTISHTDTSSNINTRSLALYGRSRATSLGRNRLPIGMNSASLALNLCDHNLNAEGSCPTLTKNHSDQQPSSPVNNIMDQRHPIIERPSDAFRNRQSRRHSHHYYEPTSTSSSSSTSPLPIHQHQDSIQQLAMKQEIVNNLTQVKETSTSTYDWEFWAKVINQFDQVKQQQLQDLRNHVCIGMPPSLRGMIWQVLSKSRHNSDRVELEYRELLNGVSPHEKIIQRDLARTFPTHTFFRQRDGDGQEMLFNVIKAYSLYDPQVGYCQGLPFIVGCLLLHMPDEAAFCVLVNLMNDYGLRGHFTPKMELLHERMFQYEELLMKHLPQVHRHLDAQGVRPTMYASQWFLTLFSYRCPLNLVFRVLDMVFTEGTSIMLNVALAFMKKNRETLLSLEFEGLLAFLGCDIFDAYQDAPSEFVKDTFAFHISPRDLAKLSKRYMIKATQDAKMQDKEDYLKNENYELSQQAKKLEKSFAILDQEHGAIARQVIESKMAMATASDDNQKLRHEISQLEQQIEQTSKDMESSQQGQVNHFAQENAQLVQQNAQLETRLADIEATLIDFKLKYAQSENEYEQMKNRLGQIRKISS